MTSNEHCWHAIYTAPNKTHVICCYCGEHGYWRGNQTQEHGPHLPYTMATFGMPVAAPVVLFHAPTCTHRKEEEG